MSFGGGTYSRSMRSIAYHGAVSEVSLNSLTVSPGLMVVFSSCLKSSNMWNPFPPPPLFGESRLPYSHMYLVLSVRVPTLLLLTEMDSVRVSVSPMSGMEALMTMLLACSMDVISMY